MVGARLHPSRTDAGLLRDRCNQVNRFMDLFWTNLTTRRQLWLYVGSFKSLSSPACRPAKRINHPHHS